MEIYKGFASIYDEAMDEIPYKEWCEDLYKYLRKNGVRRGSICELGCGTGVMTELLADCGYNMIGVDNSEEMLQIAVEKKMAAKRKDLLYIQQDMRNLELHVPMDAIVSVCDSINYLLTEKPLMDVFKSVYDNLKEDGLFVFDVKTEYCYKQLMGNQTWAEQTKDGYYIWENYFQEDVNINKYMLTIFKKEENGDLYHRYDEVHYQKGHDLNYLKKLLKDAGLRFIDSYGNRIGEKITKKSERIYIIARK